MYLIAVALGFVWAWIGHGMAVRFEHEHKTTPWGLPAALWAVVCFLFGLFALVVLLVARKSTTSKRVAPSERQHPVGGWDYQGMPSTPHGPPLPAPATAAAGEIAAHPAFDASVTITPRRPGTPSA